MSGAVAIIGMALRVPGASTPDGFWDNLRRGVESITRFSREEALRAGLPAAIVDAAGFVAAGGVLPDVDLFDADFFGYSPKDAELIDPQHRVFLECCWEAMEGAGRDPGGETAVFAGCGLNFYWLNQLARNQRALAGVDPLRATLAGAPDYLALRVSHRLGLTGVSMNVNASCSSSLLAVHLACQSLMIHECDLALAGGASIAVPQVGGHVHRQGGVTSADGRCRAFDRSASGTVFSNGVGAVLLKRLDEAVADRDPIHAVILGSAANNDGAQKAGFTAPNPDAQARVVSTALAAAGVEADSIGYVEAHGTGTQLGDPIEIAALRRAFASARARPRPCAIGSVKTNIGHLNAAAGIAGLIKAAMMVRDGTIVPSLHLASPGCDLARDTVFKVATATAGWEGGGPRRAGVSSFGLGGTNVHVVIEQPPAARPSTARPAQVLLLSARTAAALRRQRERLRKHLAAHPRLPLADVCHTLQVGRRHFPFRMAAGCRTTQDAIAALANDGPVAAPARECSVVVRLRGRDPVPEWIASALAIEEPAFARAITEADAATTDAASARASAMLRFIASVGVPIDGVIRDGPLATIGPPADRSASGGDALVLAVGADDDGIAADAAIVWSTRSSTALEAILAAVARLWTSGAAIDWGLLAAGETRARVALPTYPFERQRHWVEADAAAEPRGGHGAPDGWFHVPVWRPVVAQSLDVSSLAARWPRCLVLADRGGFARRLIDRLMASGVRPVVAIRGAAGDDAPSGSITVNPTRRDGYVRLAERLGPEPMLVIDAWPLDLRQRAPSAGAPAAFDHVRRLTSALAEARPARSWRLVALTAGACAVSEDEMADPYAAMVPALCRVLASELPRFSAQPIDLAATIAGDDALIRAAVEQVLACASGAGDGSPVALRGSRSWTEDFVPVHLLPPTPRRGPIDARWVVTGGAGGLGAAVAGLLAAEFGAHVVLVGRSPPNDARVVEALSRLRQAGACADYEMADVSDRVGMQRLGSTLERLGGVDGVVHAAGVAGGGLMMARSDVAIDAVLAPKVAGTVALLDSLPIRDGGVCVLFSSHAALMGDVGQGDYAAANAFLDAVARSPWSSGRTRIVSINWGAWRDVGMAARAGGALAERRRRHDLGIDPGEALRAFRQILDAGLPRVYVGREHPRMLRSRLAAATSASSGEGLGRDSTATPVPATDRSAVELEIRRIWAEVLGIGTIADDAAFIDVGGDSITALRVAARLRERTGVDLSLGSVLAAQTAPQLAEAVAAAARVGDRPTEQRRSHRLSFGQERLWFLTRLEPRSSFFNMAGAVLLDGHIDVAALARAVDALAARHEQLRAWFVEDAEGPRVDVVPVPTVRLATVDLSRCGAAAARRLVRRIVSEGAEAPYDLSQPCPWRVVLVRTSADEHALLLGVHHLVSDLWSMGIMVRDLSALYAAEAGGGPRPPPVPATYSDWAERQRRRVDDGGFGEASAYWRRRLLGASGATVLERDEDTGERSDLAGRLSTTMPPGSVAPLRDLARGESATVFMALCAVFATALHRATGRDDISIGCPMSGRDGVGTEDVVGFFVNPIVMRVDMSGRPSFRDLLRRIRDRALEALDHSAYPFSRIVSEVPVDRGAEAQPLFQVGFSLRNVPAHPPHAGAVRLRALDIRQGSMSQDVMLEASDDPTGLVLRLGYRKARFRAPRMRRLLDHLVALATASPADPDRPLDALPIGRRPEAGTWGGDD